MKDSPFSIQVSGIKPRKKIFYGRFSHNKKFEGGSGGKLAKFPAQPSETIVKSVADLPEAAQRSLLPYSKRVVFGKPHEHHTGELFTAIYFDTIHTSALIEGETFHEIFLSYEHI